MHRTWRRQEPYSRICAVMIRGVLNGIDLRQTSVILTSDHGNIEDLSTRNHTLNKVPTIVWGADKVRIAERIKSLADITPAIVETLTEKAAAPLREEIIRARSIWLEDVRLGQLSLLDDHCRRSLRAISH